MRSVLITLERMAEETDQRPPSHVNRVAASPVPHSVLTYLDSLQSSHN